MVNKIKGLFTNPYKEEELKMELELEMIVKEEVDRVLKKEIKQLTANVRRDILNSLQKYVNKVNDQAEREEREYYYRKGKGILTEQDEQIIKELEQERKEKTRMCINLISILEEF